MSTLTPKQVVEAYNCELWNKQNWAIGAEIISDPIVRHYPGSVVTLGAIWIETAPGRFSVRFTLGAPR